MTMQTARDSMNAKADAAFAVVKEQLRGLISAKLEEAFPGEVKFVRDEFFEIRRDNSILVHVTILQEEASGRWTRMAKETARLIVDPYFHGSYYKKVSYPSKKGGLPSWEKAVARAIEVSQDRIAQEKRQKEAQATKESLATLQAQELAPFAALLEKYRWRLELRRLSNGRYSAKIDRLEVSLEDIPRILELFTRE